MSGRGLRRRQVEQFGPGRLAGEQIEDPPLAKGKAQADRDDDKALGHALENGLRRARRQARKPSSFVRKNRRKSGLKVEQRLDFAENSAHR